MNFCFFYYIVKTMCKQQKKKNLEKKQKKLLHRLKTSLISIRNNIILQQVSVSATKVVVLYMITAVLK